MQRAHVRLIVAAVLFVGWLGFLAYLAATGTHPVILSRPQLLVADFVVEASLTGDAKPDATVTVKKVIRGPKQKDKLEPETTIDVLHLEDCGPMQGWTGAGDYILPLSKNTSGYSITRTPESPGYDPKFDFKPFRIYPATAETERQVKQLHMEQP